MSLANTVGASRTKIMINTASFENIFKLRSLTLINLAECVGGDLHLPHRSHRDARPVAGQRLSIPLNQDALVEQSPGKVAVFCPGIDVNEIGMRRDKVDPVLAQRLAERGAGSGIVLTTA